MSRTLPILLGVCLLAPAACDRRPEAPPAVVSSPAAPLDTLLERMRQRLELMHTVARVKWNAQAPIFDPDRERALLEDVVERGKTHKLDDEVTRTFFAAQMEAAKIVQEEDFQRWRAEKHPPFRDVPDLPALRQQIDALNGEILEALATARPYLASHRDNQLEARAVELFAGVPDSAGQAALRPLRRR